MNCRYAFPGTYGHECGALATSVLVTVMPESTKTTLYCLGVQPPADGLSRAERCEIHRDRREYGDGQYVRTEGIEALK